MTTLAIDPLALLKPRRVITGSSAILLPFDSSGGVDWPGFEAHVARTFESGLIPAVNMDTGYVNLIDHSTQAEVLRRTRAIGGGKPFFAGAYVADHAGSRFDRDAYLARIEAVIEAGATPVIFPSHGLTSLADDEVVQAHADLGRHTDQFVAFELGAQFAPFGRIYSLDVFRGLMSVPQCVGAKHSSLGRDLEWLRLIERDRVRPEFRIYTGNDLGIDMVMYGSDYLLGLSTFAPDLFAERDAWWASGDPRFYERNDWLQFLGSFTFRVPVPAYKHSAAMFLKLRGWIGDDRPHPSSARRPESDRAVLRTIAEGLGISTIRE